MAIGEEARLPAGGDVIFVDQQPVVVDARAERVEKRCFPLRGVVLDAFDDLSSFVQLEKKQYTSWQHYSDIYVELAQERAGRGMKTIDEIQRHFKILDEADNGKWRRDAHQRDMCNYFIAAQAESLLGSSFAECADQLREILQVEDFNRVVVAVAARQVGKTTAMAMTVAVELMCVPEFEAAIYSTGKRISTRMAEEVKKFLAKLIQYEGPKIINIKATDECIKYQLVSNPDDIRVVYSYPAAVKVSDKTEVRGEDGPQSR